MNEKEELKKTLIEAVGEEGCGVSCDNADIYKEEDGWKLKMEGFMEAWNIGQTVEEAKGRIRELASMRFGLT